MRKSKQEKILAQVDCDLLQQRKIAMEKEGSL